MQLCFFLSFLKNRPKKEKNAGKQDREEGGQDYLFSKYPWIGGRGEAGQEPDILILS